DVGLPGLPRRGAAPGRPRIGAGRRIRVPDRDGLPRGRPGRHDHRGSHRVPRSRAGQLQDVLEDHRRGARPGHVVGRPRPLASHHSPSLAPPSAVLGSPESSVSSPAPAPSLSPPPSSSPPPLSLSPPSSSPPPSSPSAAS